MTDDTFERIKSYPNHNRGYYRSDWLVTASDRKQAIELCKAKWTLPIESYFVRTTPETDGRWKVQYSYDCGD